MVGKDSFVEITHNLAFYRAMTDENGGKADSEIDKKSPTGVQALGYSHTQENSKNNSCNNEATCETATYAEKAVEENAGNGENRECRKSKSQKKRTGTYNPYERETRLAKRNSEMVKSLQTTSALELCVEFYGMSRIEFFGEARCFAVVFTQGSTKDTWEVVDKSEDMKCSSHMRCFKKFRVRAGTELDRQERAMIALFSVVKSEPEEKEILVSEAWAYAEFTVGEVLDSEHMMLERRLTLGKNKTVSKGTVSLVLDVIYHMKDVKKVSIDFGVLEEAPRRNRMYFEICKALRRGKWAPLYKSEVRCHSEVGKFDVVTFDGQDFHGGDVGKLFRLEVYRWYRNGRFKLLGFIQTNYEKLSSLKAHDQLYWWPAPNGISSAKIVVENVVETDGAYTFSLRLGNMF